MDVVMSERDDRASLKVVEDGGQVRGEQRGVVVGREFFDAAQQHDRLGCRPAQGARARRSARLGCRSSLAVVEPVEVVIGLVMSDGAFARWLEADR